MNEQKSPDSEQMNAIERAVHSRGTVLVILFGVLGVLGLPVLWISRGFDRREKIFWSVMVTIYTLVLVAIAVGCVWYAWQQWEALMG